MPSTPRPIPSGDTPRLALVTGANRGLGRAVSARLLDLGYDVAVAARNGTQARRAAAELGGRSFGLQIDVTEPADVDRAVDVLGRVDILINNAGVLLAEDTRPSVVPLDLVGRELAINAIGAWRMSQACLPGMLRRGWGRIVMVSSGTGSFSNGLFTGAPGYAVSKTALNAITLLLATETRDRGVLVNAVNPGLVRTRMRPDAARSPEAAADDVVWAATLPDTGPTGAFFRGCQLISW
ncbi:SDR family NAD(P)-dependent oxidoreductase [Nonomuraea sp. NPDC059007]|uniref:SDR family NAD(P)-dependent oxidoreductase n=1 Tax=Nonomuraea sp. NPDC059007 TaxID=3346692 RepID=UPI0036760402